MKDQINEVRTYLMVGGINEQTDEQVNRYINPT